MSLRDFLKKMENQKEVAHISDEVSPKYEISSIINALPEGPIFSFDNVLGQRTRIVGNVCGTRNRMCSALETTSEGFYSRLLEALRYPKPAKVVEDGPVKEVVEEPNLKDIPVLTHFERDSGPYITACVVSAKSLDGKIENVSVHRLLVLDNTHLAIRLVPRHLFKIWNVAKAEEKDLDVAVAIGLHPGVLLAAASSPPFGASEYHVANALLGGELRLIKCEKVDAFAPSEAELVLEGRISFQQEVEEGPFVDITGAYDAQRMQPVIEVVKMMHRENYLYQALLPGGAEHKLLMGMPRETTVYESVSRVVPAVKAVNFSAGGCGWLHAILSIEKQTDGDAKNALLAAFSAHPSLKHAAVVDSDIDVFDSQEVEWALATRFQADEDLIIIPKARGSTLDPSANMQTGLTTKWGIDATRPLSASKEDFEKAKVPISAKAAKIVEKIKSNY